MVRPDCKQLFWCPVVLHWLMELMETQQVSRFMLCYIWAVFRISGFVLKQKKWISSQVDGDTLRASFWSASSHSDGLSTSHTKVYNRTHSPVLEGIHSGALRLYERRSVVQDDKREQTWHEKGFSDAVGSTSKQTECGGTIQDQTTCEAMWI